MDPTPSQAVGLALVILGGVFAGVAVTTAVGTYGLLRLPHLVWWRVWAPCLLGLGVVVYGYSLVIEYDEYSPPTGP